MPNIKSAKKRVLIAERNNMRNKAIKTNLKTTIKKANAAVEANDGSANEAVKEAIKKIDQARAKGVMHKNTAARRKSAMAKKLNA